MSVKKAKYFSVAAENRPGELAKFARTLKDNNVNLAGIWGFGTGPGKARIICVPQDPQSFKKAAGPAGWDAQEGTCYRLEGEDRVGALVETLEKIAGQGINLHAVDAVSLGGRFAAYVWSDPKDEEQLGRALGA